MLRRSKGLTLIEVLVCVAVIAAASVFVLPGFVVASRILQSSEGKGEAYLEAANALARWTILARTAESQEEFPEEDEARFASRLKDARVQMAARPVTEDAALRYVDLTLSWRGGRGEEAYGLHTLVRVPEGAE